MVHGQNKTNAKLKKWLKKKIRQKGIAGVRFSTLQLWGWKITVINILIFSFQLGLHFVCLLCIPLCMFTGKIFFVLISLLHCLPIWTSPSPVSHTSFTLAAARSRALRPHLRYDNQLISQRSPFPRGSFVCKILTLIWHVDIIKLMKCNCNEQVRHSICSGTPNEKDPSLLTC